MKYLICTCVLAILLATPAAAQEPTPTPNFTMPYNFQPLDYESETPTGINLVDLISDVGFINAIGSYVVTMWAMLDDYSFIGYLVIFLMAIWVLKWTASFVFKKDLMGNVGVDASGMFGLYERDKLPVDNLVDDANWAERQAMEIFPSNPDGAWRLGEMGRKWRSEAMFRSGIRAGIRGTRRRPRF